MKKIIIFLITILTINTILILNVKASNVFSFYEGDYIQNIWITKKKDGIKYYQKARFFMSADYNTFAYCVEPFAMFNENSRYNQSITANNLSIQQSKRISLIAYFGYNYKNHTSEKWYAITQYMIWKEASPSEDIYFTDSLNGNRINIFTEEMNEINNLINNYLTLPSITNSEIDIVEGQTITLTDSNNVLNNYISNNSNAVISKNQLHISNLEAGTHTINLTRDNKLTSRIPLFFNSNDSQNMTIVGDVDNINISLKINVIKTSLEITKIDKDTQDIISSGEGILSGATYQIYDKDMNELELLTINDDKKANLNNLNFGKYYIKEITPGKGYNLDNTIYEFVIDKNNFDIKLTLENEIIKKKVEINKEYGDNLNSNKESNINFDIYDYSNNLYKTIITDNNGYACIYLPYGKYLIKQRNSTPGYAFNEDFNIEVSSEESIKYNLFDYKIKVPDTSKHCNNYFTILLFLGGIYVKKRILY